VPTLLRRVIDVANVLSFTSLALMALITVVDVGGRYLLNRPLLGSLEMSELLMVFLVFGAFSVTELHNGHVEVDVLVNRMGPRARALCESFAALLSVAFWGAITWRTALRAQNIGAAGETTPNLELPIGPFVWIAAAGCLLFTLALITRLLGALRRVSQA
jgi:TRAP-type C4-dicarboxylate transport system permease small subunit